MALFTDGLVSSVEDLLAYEADLLDVASASGIELGTKLKVAQAEVGAQLEASSRRPGNIYYAGQAGWQSTGADVSLPRFDLSQVVVTTPLKLWHTYQSLALFFRDAHTRKLNDKYAPKWKEYRDLSQWASDLLFQTGVGLAAAPIPRAEKPKLETAAGTIAGMSLFVRMTWARGEEEGAGSIEQAIRTLANQLLRVTPPKAPETATGWNVYIGTSKGKALRQNEAPLSLTDSWTMPESGLVDGELIGDGQAADLLRTAPRFLQRG